MAMDPLATFGGPVAAVMKTTQAATKNDGVDTNRKTGNIPVPKKASEIPAWGMGMGLGEAMASGMLEKNPEAWAGHEEELKTTMKMTMVEMMKSMSKSNDSFKEMFADDEDDGGWGINFQ